MNIKYNRVSTLKQNFITQVQDKNNYDLVLSEKVSGAVAFKDREEGSKLLKLVRSGEVSQVTVNDFSRLGRNAPDILSTLEVLDKHKVNVHILNMKVDSIVDGKPNPIWKMFSGILSVMYDMERENIMERTKAGIEMYVAGGGKLGRPSGSNENVNEFLKKKSSKTILRYLKKEYTIREVARISGTSNNTVMKVKKAAIERGVLN